MAAGRNLNAKFILSLRDGVSAGLGALKRRLDGLANAGRRIGLLGAGIAAISFIGPIQSAAAYQDTLLQTQITAGGVGRAAVDAANVAGRAYERLALETGQRSRDIAGAAANLAAAGISPEQAAQFMPVLARTATATGASMEDLSKTAIALRQNLRITTAQELADTFGTLAQAGKQGMFELRDMAREFPALTAAWQGIIDTANQAAAAQGRVSQLSTSGREAAASMGALLQVARQGAASSSEAANNLANFLQKLTSPETVRNFREMGVNLEGVLGDAAAQGINPVEAMLQKIREKTGGDMFKVGQLFGDRQVLDFLRPALRGTGEYLDMLKGALAANEALINQDFSTRMQGAAMRLGMVSERGEQLLRRLGVGAAASLGPVNGLLERLQNGIDWLDTHYPGVLDKTLAWTAGIAMLVGAAATLVPVLGFLASGFALLFSPITLVLGALGLVVWALRDWEGFTAFFSGVWEGIKGSFVGFEAFLGKWRAAFDAVAEALKGPWETLKGFFSDLWGGIEERFSRFVASVRAFFGPLLTIIERVRSRTEEQPGPAQGQVNARMAGRANRIEEGWDEPEAAVAGGGAPATAELRGRLVIEAAPGLRVREAGSDNPGVEFQGSRGQVLGRP